MTGSDDMKLSEALERGGVPIEPASGEPVVQEIILEAHPFSMAKVLKPGRVGRFAIEASTIYKGTIVAGYERYKGRKTIITYNFDCPVIKLTEDGNPWMSDNMHEVESTVGAVEVASGDVLVGGLGMGLFPTWIKDKVNSIDIVELNQEVIDLVFHQVATEKMKIIHDEIYHYLRTTDKQYDFIFIDIWQDTLSPFWEIDGARKLAQRCLKPGGTTWCWMQEQYDSHQRHKL